MSEADLAGIARSLRLQAAPEGRGAAPGRQFCGDIDMRIARDGTWFYHGSPIGRKPLVKLFARALARDENGDFWLETPVEKARIRVDDAPFVAVEMFADGAGADRRLRFRTNVDDVVTLDADHPLRVETDVESGAPAPYLTVRGRLEALVARAVFYDLVELGEERESDEGAVLGVWSGGRFFPLGRVAEDQAPARF